MSNEFEYLMYLFSCGARGLKANNPSLDVNFDKVITLAKEQSVYHTVLYALELIDDRTLPEVESVLFNSQLKNDVIFSYIRRVRILKLLDDFETAGICAVLLKGYAAASLYALPDSRMSWDVDIYVALEDEKRARQLLKQSGFALNPRDKRSNHSACEHPEIGHIELHIRLYYKMIEDVWFNRKLNYDLVKQPYEKVSADEGSYYTLGKTDNLIFLTLHMIKHFIESGMSLRLIMDFSLFYYTYHDEVDLIRFWNAIEIANYKYLVEVILSIAVKCFDFDSEVMLRNTNEVDENDMKFVLADLETGGFLGSKEKNVRKEGVYEYNRIKFMQNRRNENYKIYMILWNTKASIKALFASKNSLLKKFPYADNNSILVSIKLICHIFTRGVRCVTGGELKMGVVNGEADLNETAKKRVELFRRMKIIE